MFKKIALLALAIMLIAYIVFAVFILNSHAGKTICKDLEVVVIDTLDRHFIGNRDITALVKNAGLNPIGKNLSEINTGAIEEKVLENKLVKRAECYKTPEGNVKIEVYQKIPILRIFSTSGSYYVDSEGETMPLPPNFSIYVPIASGYVEKEFARTKLYEFALFLHNDKFWNTQIEQIYVASDQDVELTPRVGGHQIILGKIDDYVENLEKLRLFYDKGLSEVGWNRYAVINLKYKNQVVCTKK